MVDEAGTPESILKIAKELGMLSQDELDILLQIKHGEQLDAAKNEVVNKLLDKKLIQKS